MDIAGQILTTCYLRIALRPVCSTAHAYTLLSTDVPFSKYSENLLLVTGSSSSCGVIHPLAHFGILRQTIVKLLTMAKPTRDVASRGSRGFLAQTVLEISGSQLNPLRTFSLNIYGKI